MRVGPPARAFALTLLAIPAPVGEAHQSKAVAGPALTAPLESVISSHARSLRDAEIVPIGVGYYTAAEAARLLKTTPRKISRWLGGYSYKVGDGQIVETTPLWSPQLPRVGDSLEIGFRDLSNFGSFWRS